MDLKFSFLTAVSPSTQQHSVFRWGAMEHLVIRVLCDMYNYLGWKMLS